MANLPEVTTPTFSHEVLDSPVPVVVDFMATWCAPCRMVAPLLERAAAEFAGQVKIVQLDTDAYPETAAAYGVQKIPNISFFQNGQIVDQAIGYINEADLQQKLQALLAD